MKKLILILILLSLIGFKNESQSSTREGLTLIEVPSSSDWNKKGLDFALNGEYEKALNAFNHALKIEPKNPRFWKNKAFLIFNNNSYPEDAIAAFNMVIKLNPKETLYKQRGISLYRARYYKEASKLLSKALMEDKTDSNLWYLKGKCLNQLLKKKEAIKAYDKAIKIDSSNPLYWNAKGEVLTSIKQYKNSISSYNKAIKIKPDNYLFWLNKGFSLIQLNQKKASIDAFDKSIGIKPTYGAFFNKGFILSSLGRFDEAVSAYDEAIKINHNSSEAWNNKGNCLRKKGLIIQAIKAYRKAINYDGKNDKVVLFAKISELCMLTNNFVKAKKTIKSADIYLRTDQEKILVSSFKYILNTILKENTLLNKRTLDELKRKKINVNWSFAEVKKKLVKSNLPNKSKVLKAIQIVEGS